MTTFKETFTGSEDRARVLTEILRHGPAVAGTTLIALVDRTTQAVLAVRSMPAPVPILDDESYFDEDQILQLSRALCALADETAPVRTWNGNRWGEITGEFITVVCREGPARMSPIEALLFYGWRYSNHNTAALHGDVYAVTPHGWANLSPEYSGALPALPALPEMPELVERPDPASAAPEVLEAERVLADASLALLGPEPRECLLCYVHRMMMEFGCDGRLRFAGHYRDARAPRATALERRLGTAGGYCDCEIFLNGYELRQAYWVPEMGSQQEDLDDDDDPELTWPTPLPRCTGVRGGSTQPCRLWDRLYRW